MSFKGSNEGKSFPKGRDDMGIDTKPRPGKPFKGSGQMNIEKGQPTKEDPVTGKTKNTSGEAIT